jgi:SHS family lactate transporter-like MFS transporter
LGIRVGNFLASYNGPFQAKIAETKGGNYAYALALVGVVVAVATIIVIRLSPERSGELLHAH